MCKVQSQIQYPSSFALDLFCYFRAFESKQEGDLYFQDQQQAEYDCLFLESQICIKIMFIYGLCIINLGFYLAFFLAEGVCRSLLNHFFTGCLEVIGISSKCVWSATKSQLSGTQSVRYPVRRRLTSPII